MDGRSKQFSLRLARSLKEAALKLARQDGVSLNQFIAQAIAEKIARVETGDQAVREKTGYSGRTKVS